MADPNVLDRMRADWNDRAREDANYYVAFGRRGQDDPEFFSTAAEVLPVLEGELKRLAARAAALEIGCGPGRLLRPMSRHFGEIHGVDVSDEMVRLARERLADVANARVHATSGADLAPFAAETFDFVYSYAVFQHIPSREVVFRYLEETRRVLKPGGVLRCQINGLPQTAARYTTWDGVRIAAAEVAEFARAHDFQLLGIEGVLTQYMWTTMRKMPAGWAAGLKFRSGAALRNATNAHTGEAAVPTVGPLAAVSLWIEDLPAECDLNHLAVTVDGRECRLSYVGEAENGITQLNAALPEAVRTGLAPVEVLWLGRPLCVGWARLIPAGPRVPRLCIGHGWHQPARRAPHRERAVQGFGGGGGAPRGLPRHARRPRSARPGQLLHGPAPRALRVQLPRAGRCARRSRTRTLTLGRRVLAVMPVEVA